MMETFDSTEVVDSVMESLDDHDDDDNDDGNDEVELTDSLGQPPPAKKQKTDPDSWNVGTSPWEVVWYYAKPNVKDETIQNEFEKHQIVSLETLSDAAGELAHNILIYKCTGEMVNKIDAALARTKKKPVMVLGGKLELERTCIDQESIDRYTFNAVSATQKSAVRYRYPNVAIVTGPSGSGKTMYALNCLPEMLLPGAVSQKKSFRVHLTASNLLGDFPNPNFDLPSQVVKQVTAIVARRLSPTFGQTLMPIDLHLFVTIDEAGRREYAPFFDTTSKIEQIVTALEAMKDGYAFEKGVHVTVTGTGLQTSTRNIDSNSDALKVAMQPWLLANFFAMLRKLKRDDEEPVKALVGRFPVLTDLTSNARCAYFLGLSIPKVAFENELRWAGYVNLAVADVARHYINSNGLKSLSSMNAKFTVVQEAFKAINEAMVPTSSLVFPQFDHIHDEVIRSATSSLFGINVEMKNGKPKLTGKYSLSMTPAIAIVLAELLLCEKAAISWNWQGFENTAALGEWKTMIATMQLSEFTNSCGILNMQSPVPSGNADVRFTVPLVTRSTVLVNGPAAPYADVMAPFRLLQVKFSAEVNQHQRLDFLKEIGKMGLTTHREYRLNQAVTSVLYVMWQRPPTTINDDHVGKFERPGYNRDARCEHYPYQALLSSYDPAIATARFKILGRLWNQQVGPDGNDEAARGLLGGKPIKVLEEFTSARPVTAVFATNGLSFILNNGTSSDLTIAREDVDWQGRLKSKTLPNYLVSNLRRNVEVRFLFY